MKQKTLTFLLIIFISFTYKLDVFGQADTAKIGLFINNLYDFDIGNGQFTAEFWMWANYNKKSEANISFESSPEVKWSKSSTFSNYLLEEKNNIKWMTKKCKAVVIHDWDVTKFPFDNQVIKIQLEETDKDASSLVYIDDKLNSKIDENLKLDEWSIDSFKTSHPVSKYNTSYGDPTLNEGSEYSSISANIYMTRLSSWTLFIKMTTGLYVAFLISLLVFTILPPDSESRIGLAVGGLFAAVGNKYIVESIVPMSTQNTLIDNLHNITFLFILLIVATVIFVTNLYVNGKETLSRKMDKLALIFYFSIFLIINIFLISKAL